MKRIHEELTDPRDHLAADEAVLLEADASGDRESLRIWEFAEPCVIVGRASKVDAEVDREFCRAHGIEVFRRCSGGAAIVGGPGCLMYSVVLSFAQRPDLQKIDVAHQYVMHRVLSAIARQLPDVELQGTCDLTWRDRKFSGNSLRVARQHVLYHGTILYRADLSRIAACLREAPRQPEYRARRDHADFVTNVDVDPTRLSDDLAREFEAQDSATKKLPWARMSQLRRQRYDDPKWHFRH